MLQISRILCPIDFSDSSIRALHHALVLADWHEATLDVLHVSRDADRALLFEQEELQKYIAEALPGGGQRELQLRQMRRQGDSPRDAIVGHAENEDIDLVVIGTSDKAALERWFLGSTAEGVVRLSPCPVLTVRSDSSRPVRETIEKILVPVDFSDSTRHALDYGRELAQTYGARIDLLHVVVDEVPALAYGHHGDLNYLDTWVHDAEIELADLARDYIGYEHVQVHVLRGQAAYEVLNFAREEESDMIVLSTHGRTGVERLLLGSTAEKIVRQAPCPVFTLKTYGKSLLPSSRAGGSTE